MARRNHREFLLRNQSHVFSKPVPLAGNGDDIPMVLRRLPQSLAKHEDIAAEIGLLHKRVGPHRLHQIVFADDLPAVADQHQQDLKRLRGDRDQLAGANQRLLFGINPKRPELVLFPCLLVLAGSHSIHPLPLIFPWLSNLISNEDQGEISAPQAHPCNLNHFSDLLGCEKLSEDFKASGRTFHPVRRQPQLIPYSVLPGKQGLLPKQTKITIETDSLLILNGQSSQRLWCSACAAEVESIALERTGVISNLDQSALEEWLNSEDLHRLEAADGSAPICLSSLLARVQKTKNHVTAASAVAQQAKEKI